VARFAGLRSLGEWSAWLVIGEKIGRNARDGRG